MDYKEEDKSLIEKSSRYKYYDFTKEKIKQIISKNITDVDNEEWRILLQMMYPNKMIGSGLFQPILIFKINKQGKRVDPPVEAYNKIDKVLLPKIMKHIEKNSELKIHNSWYDAKAQLLAE